ncbi:MAG: acyl-CoA dehydrogenase, partial [Caulobacteraceae bacterium]|nr:acyl-CoA dehydrogenase [Caulobacteraceae bacterium]
QYLRDIRITPIYEGANGIQAIDLAGRKLGLADGEGVSALLAEARTSGAAMEGHADPRLAPIGRRLTSAVQAADEATAWMAQRRGDPDALAGASEYLALMGDMLGGWLLGKGAVAAAEGRAGDDAYAAARIDLAGFYADTVLTLAPGKAATVVAGSARLAALNASAFGAG